MVLHDEIHPTACRGWISVKGERGCHAGCQIVSLDVGKPVVLRGPLFTFGPAVRVPVPRGVNRGPWAHAAVEDAV